MSFWFGQSNQPDDESVPNTRSTGRPLHPPLGVPTPRGRGRTPSPRPSDQQQFFPPNPQSPRPPSLQVEPASSPSNFEDINSQDFEEEFTQEVEQSAASSMESEIDRLQRVAEAAIAAATAATTALAAAQSKIKKPDLPAFDKKNVDLWIQRVEAAYTRSSITLPKDKFAFLESKFPVDFNTVINSYLFGEATAEKWTEFLTYLKNEYGRTTRQQTNILLSSHSRSGLRPTQFLVNLQEKTKKVKIDDIHKEILLKSLPADVQHALLDKVDTMSSKEVATAADKYFDSEGRPISTSTASVSAIQQEQQEEEPHFSQPFSDDEPDVSAVSGRKFSKDNKFGGGFNSFKNKPRFSNTSSTSFNNQRSGSSGASSFKSNIKPNGLCWAHDKFKDQANNCYQGCRKFAQHTGKKVYSGNGMPGRRA